MSNAHTFRTFARLEETMMRAMMPRTDAADPKPVALPRSNFVWSNGRRVAAVAPLTFKLAEVAHA